VFPITGEQTAKVLFLLGIVIAVVGVIMNVYSFLHAISVHAIGYNLGTFIISIFSPLGQGGLLVGVAKIIEILDSKRS